MVIWLRADIAEQALGKAWNCRIMRAMAYEYVEVKCVSRNVEEGCGGLELGIRSRFGEALSSVILFISSREEGVGSIFIGAPRAPLYSYNVPPMR